LAWAKFGSQLGRIKIKKLIKSKYYEKFFTNFNIGTGVAIRRASFTATPHGWELHRPRKMETKPW
jgi:hypothetical protein